MDERVEKYWICPDCADKRGLKCFKTGNTTIAGLCGWCDRKDEVMLTPMCDFKVENEPT